MNPTVVAYVIHALVGEFGLPDQLRFATVLHNNASLFSITSYSLKIFDPSQKMQGLIWENLLNSS